MKELYKTPEISVEVLQSVDVLLSSPTTPIETDPSVFAKERENRYGSFADFIIKGDWFS